MTFENILAAVGIAVTLWSIYLFFRPPRQNVGTINIIQIIQVFVPFLGDSNKVKRDSAGYSVERRPSSNSVKPRDSVSYQKPISDYGFFGQLVMMILLGPFLSLGQLVVVIPFLMGAIAIFYGIVGSLASDISNRLLLRFFLVLIGWVFSYLGVRGWLSMLPTDDEGVLLKIYYFISTLVILYYSSRLTFLILS